MRLTEKQLETVNKSGWRKTEDSTGYKVAIGIDPGKSTGYAVWDRKLKVFISIETTDFWSAYAQVQQYPIDEAVIIVEKPRTKASFRRYGKKQTDAAKHTMSVNVGMVYREAELMIAGLERLGYKVIKQHPQGKLNKELFESRTGYTKRTSEHGRDAAMLCYQF